MLMMMMMMIDIADHSHNPRQCHISLCMILSCFLVTVQFLCLNVIP